MQPGIRLTKVRGLYGHQDSRTYTESCTKSMSWRPQSRRSCPHSLCSDHWQPTDRLETLPSSGVDGRRGLRVHALESNRRQFDIAERTIRARTDIVENKAPPMARWDQPPAGQLLTRLLLGHFVPDNCAFCTPLAGWSTPCKRRRDFRAGCNSSLPIDRKVPPPNTARMRGFRSILRRSHRN